MDIKNKIRCENCSSVMGYYRKKDNTYVCRSCGKITNLDKEKIEETQQTDSNEEQINKDIENNGESIRP